MKTIFTDNDTATQFLERISWPNKVLCVYCGSDKTFQSVIDERYIRPRHRCSSCQKSFTVTTNTLFHKTRILLVKYFQLIKLMYEQKDVTVRRASVELQLSKATVYNMVRRLREATGEHRKLIGIIENEAKKENNHCT